MGAFNLKFGEQMGPEPSFCAHVERSGHDLCAYLHMSISQSHFASTRGNNSNTSQVIL